MVLDISPSSSVDISTAITRPNTQHSLDTGLVLYWMCLTSFFISFYYKHNSLGARALNTASPTGQWSPLVHSKGLIRLGSEVACDPLERDDGKTRALIGMCPYMSYQRACVAWLSFLSTRHWACINNTALEIWSCAAVMFQFSTGASNAHSLFLI